MFWGVEVKIQEADSAVMSSQAVYSLSLSLPLYIVEEYERLLAVIYIKLEPNPDQSPSARFWDLFTAHSTLKSLPEAVTYLYRILEGLQWEDLSKLKDFIMKDLKIDQRVTDALRSVNCGVNKYLNSLDGQLGDYQLGRYRLAVTVLCNGTLIPPKNTFLQIYEILRKWFGNYPPAVAFTIAVLGRSGWGDTKKLKPFASPNFDLNKDYPDVDLCLTVADYYGNMSDRDFSSAKIYTSAVYLNNHNVSNLSRVDFTLLLHQQNKISVGDISKIEDERRYPIFFKDYKKRCIGRNIVNVLYGICYTVELKQAPPPMVKPQSETHESTSTTTALSTGNNVVFILFAFSDIEHVSHHNLCFC